MPRKKVKFVSDWKRCWKWLSFQFTVVGVGMSCAWGFLTPDLQNAIPNKVTASIALLIFFLIALGRIIDQKKDCDK